MTEYAKAQADPREYGWPTLTEEQIVKLYDMELQTDQEAEAKRLGLCDEAREEICDWHSETDAFEHYERCRRKAFER